MGWRACVSVFDGSKQKELRDGKNVIAEREDDEPEHSADADEPEQSDDECVLPRELPVACCKLMLRQAKVAIKRLRRFIVP